MKSEGSLLSRAILGLSGNFSNILNLQGSQEPKHSLQIIVY